LQALLFPHCGTLNTALSKAARDVTRFLRVAHTSRHSDLEYALVRNNAVFTLTNARYGSSMLSQLAKLETSKTTMNADFLSNRLNANFVRFS